MADGQVRRVHIVEISPSDLELRGPFPGDDRVQPRAWRAAGGVACAPQPAHLRDLPGGIDVGTATLYHDICEALALLATMTPTLEQAIKVATRRRS